MTGPKFISNDMMINTLISDPAVALELGRRVAANAKRQPRHRSRLGVVLTRLFAERNPSAKSLRAHV